MHQETSVFCREISFAVCREWYDDTRDVCGLHLARTRTRVFISEGSSRQNNVILKNNTRRGSTRIDLENKDYHAYTNLPLCVGEARCGVVQVGR